MLQVGHLWVMSGLLCGPVGQVAQQVWPIFKPNVDDNMLLLSSYLINFKQILNV